jgi:hypothetical protein
LSSPFFCDLHKAREHCLEPRNPSEKSALRGHGIA